MDFGDAIRALKRGDRVARKGWNGKGIWLALSCGDMNIKPQANVEFRLGGGDRLIDADKFWSPHNASYARENGGHAVVAPCITMKAADGKIIMGWLASQTDMLCDDWEIV